MGVELPVIAAVVAVVIVLVARIWRGDRSRDRGPMSSAMATRGDLAALGGTIDEPGPAHDAGHGHDHGEHGHDHGEHGHGDDHGEHGHDHGDDARTSGHGGA